MDIVRYSIETWIMSAKRCDATYKWENSRLLLIIKYVQYISQNGLPFKVVNKWMKLNAINYKLGTFRINYNGALFRASKYSIFESQKHIISIFANINSQNIQQQSNIYDICIGTLFPCVIVRLMHLNLFEDAGCTVERVEGWGEGRGLGRV